MDTAVLEEYDSSICSVDLLLGEELIGLYKHVADSILNRIGIKFNISYESNDLKIRIK
jgi:hypothetical protein